MGKISFKAKVSLSRKRLVVSVIALMMCSAVLSGCTKEEVRKETIPETTKHETIPETAKQAAVPETTKQATVVNALGVTKEEVVKGTSPEFNWVSENSTYHHDIYKCMEVLGIAQNENQSVSLLPTSTGNLLKVEDKSGGNTLLAKFDSGVVYMDANPPKLLEISDKNKVEQEVQLLTRDSKVISPFKEYKGKLTQEMFNERLDHEGRDFHVYLYTGAYGIQTPDMSIGRILDDLIYDEDCDISTPIYIFDYSYAPEYGDGAYKYLIYKESTQDWSWYASNFNGSSQKFTKKIDIAITEDEKQYHLNYFKEYSEKE